MSGSKQDEPGIEIKKSAPKITPPGYKIKLSTEQAVAIAEFVDSKTFKILETVFAAQRKDQIARLCLNSAQTLDQVFLFRGATNELVQFFKTMREVKKALQDDIDKE